MLFDFDFNSTIRDNYSGQRKMNFILSEEDRDAIVRRYFFGGKMEDQLIEQGADPELAKELTGMIILDDFSPNKSEGLKTGDVITMTFVGRED